MKIIRQLFSLPIKNFAASCSIARVFWLSLLLLLFTGTVSAQIDPVKKNTVPAPKKNNPVKKESVKKTVYVEKKAGTQTIKFVANAPAQLWIDGVKKGQLQPGTAARYNLPLGDYMLLVKNADNPSDEFQATLTVTETGTERLYPIDMQGVINSRLQKEEQDKREATAKEVKRAQQEKQKKKREEIQKNMVPVQAGEFIMGNNSEGFSRSEAPPHKVTLKQFYINKYEVTNAEFNVFCRATGAEKPNEIKNEGNMPVLTSWNLAVAYCKWLSEESGNTYRLPTEAEWEFAAKGGNKSHGFLYSGSNRLEEIAWSNKSGLHTVGQKKPNELGIYDMTGNEWEFCQDWFEYYTKDAVENPQGPSSGTLKVRRGGSWYSPENESRITKRYNCPPDGSHAGFRIALTTNL